MEYQSATEIRETRKIEVIVDEVYPCMPKSSHHVLIDFSHLKYEEDIIDMGISKIEGDQREVEDMIMMSEPSTEAENTVDRKFIEVGRDIIIPFEQTESKLRYVTLFVIVSVVMKIVSM